MTAIVGVLLAIALLLHLAKLPLGPVGVTFFEVAGLLAPALYPACVGARHPVRRR